jgi:hypothetical protein
MWSCILLTREVSRECATKIDEVSDFEYLAQKFRPKLKRRF